MIERKLDDLDDQATSPGRLIYIANTDWYLYNFRLNLLEAARRQGWDVGFIAPHDLYFEKLEQQGFAGQVETLDSAGMNPMRELRTLFSLVSKLKATKPDVLHLFTLKCVLYGCLAAPLIPNTRIIGAITGMGHLFTTTNLRNRIVRPPVILALRFAIKRSGAKLVFQNTADRDEFVSYRIVAFENTSVIRGSGVDCTHFKPNDAELVHTTVPRLLFCGRLIQEKGIREYLGATNALKASGHRFESRIAGAPYPGNPSSLKASEVEALSESHDHTLLGHHEDMAQLFRDTDIVVLPTYREGTPKALLEAIACGCIVITTDIPGCRGVVDDGENGYLVEPKNTDAVASAVSRVLNMERQDQDRMRQASRHIAEERFSDTEVNRKTLALYE